MNAAIITVVVCWYYILSIIFHYFAVALVPRPLVAYDIVHIHKHQI